MNQDLIAAVNLIADHVSKHLPDGYTIRLDFSSDEASMSLLRDDEDTDFAADGDDSTIVEACDWANREAVANE